MDTPKAMTIRIPASMQEKLYKKCNANALTVSHVVRQAIIAYISSKEVTPHFYLQDQINIRPIHPVGRPVGTGKPKKEVPLPKGLIEDDDVIQMEDGSLRPRHRTEFTEEDKEYIKWACKEHNVDPNQVYWKDDRGHLWDKYGCPWNFKRRIFTWNFEVHEIIHDYKPGELDESKGVYKPGWGKDDTNIAIDIDSEEYREDDEDDE